jgi:hypothetical protein
MEEMKYLLNKVTTEVKASDIQQKNIMVNFQMETKDTAKVNTDILAVNMDTLEKNMETLAVNTDIPVEITDTQEENTETPDMIKDIMKMNLT